MVKLIRRVGLSKLEFTNEDERLQEIIAHQVHQKLGVKIDGIEHNQLYRTGRIDGLKRFFNKDGTFATGLLPQVDDVLKGLQRVEPTLEIEYINEYPERWVEDEEFPENVVLPDDKLGEITLRDYQYRSVREAVLNQSGLIHVATNGGKTEIGAGIFKTLIPQLEDGERMIFIVPTKEIFYGAQERLEMRLGQPIGLLGDGKRDIKQVTVVLMPTLVSSLKDPTKDVKITPKERKYQIMIDEVIPKFKGKKNLNTLIRNFLQGYPGTTKARSEIREELMELLHANLSDAKITMEFNKYETYFKKAMEKKAGKKYQKYLETLEFMDSVVCLICDETHRAKGDTWFDTIVQFKNAQYRIGMTGTIDKKDPMLTQKLQGLFGEVLERVANEELIGKGFSAKPYIKFVNVKEPRTISDIREYQSAYDNGIVHNEHRNQVIARMCKTVHDTNKTVLIIVNRLDHGENIREELEKLGVYSEFINGELATDVRKQQLADVKSGKLKVLIATTVLDEGVDISGIHCLILGAGGKSLRQTLQRVGRILRRKEDDNSALVIDFYDRTNMYLFNHSKERHKIYNEEGFDVDFLN